MKQDTGTTISKELLIDHPIILSFKWNHVVTIIDNHFQFVTATFFRNQYPIRIKKKYLEPMTQNDKRLHIALLDIQPPSWTEERIAYWKTIYSQLTVYKIPLSAFHNHPVIFFLSKSKQFYTAL